METTAGRTRSTVSAMLGNCSIATSPPSFPLGTWVTGGGAMGGSFVAVGSLEQAPAARTYSITTASK